MNEREACVLLPKQQEVHNSEVLLHKTLFLGFEPVTFQSRDNNFTVASRLTLYI